MLSHLKTCANLSECDLDQVVENIFTREEIQRVYFVSPVTYDTLRRNALVVKPDVTLVDSAALVRLLNLVWGTKMRRYSFDTASLAPAVYAYADSKKLRVAIIGAKEEENRTYCRELVQKYNNIELVYSRDGYFGADGADAVIEQLETLRPDLIVVGLGAPAQEAFCNRIPLVPGQKIFTCGGHISQSARAWEYYPKIVNAIHLRWLYRLVKEPHTRKRFPAIFAGLFHAWRDASIA